MVGDRAEQWLRVLGRNAGRQYADVDTAGVHGHEHVLERGGGRQVSAEELGDALVSGLAHEGRGGLAAQGVDPEVDDRHAGSAVPGADVGTAASAASAFAWALALAARR